MNLLRNAAFNFIGALLPAMALFATIPIVVGRLGADTYGMLVLITSIVGYFGIIDVNATAGSVKYVAEFRARGEHERASEVVSFGLLLYGAIGLAGALALWFGAEALVERVFKVPEAWRDEAQGALRLSAFAFVVGQLQLYLQSIPQAMHRFDLSGQLDALFGTVVPLVTIAVVLAGGGLFAIVAARLAVSAVHCGLLVRLLLRLMPDFRLLRPKGRTVRQVSSFSAYAYLQRLAAVTHQNADKLLIGARHTMTDLATYVIPYTLLARLFGMLYRLTQSVFPMASALAAAGEMAELKRKYRFASRYTVYLNACVCLMFSLFAQEVLHFWLGKGGLAGGAPLILVLVGYSLFLESLSNIPSLVNDGLGRPHISGGAALMRVALGVAAAWWALANFGVVALALSQLLVSALMSLVFVALVHRWSLPWTLREMLLPVYGPGFAVLTVGSIAVAWRVGAEPMAAGPFVSLAALCVAGLGAVGWCLVLSAEHRRRLRSVVLLRVGRRVG